LSETKPLTQKAYNYIYRKVINGEITVNDIISENRLIEELGISKSPIREALVSLCNENILQSIPRIGYRVVQIMPDEVLELYETRLLLERTLLSKTVKKITNEQIEQLILYFKNARCNFSTFGYMPVERWNSNSGFHLLLASFGENRYMYRLLEITLRTCARAATQYFIDVSKGLYEDSKALYHEQLINALKKHDEKTAIELIEKDLYSFFNYSFSGEFYASNQPGGGNG
jgi:DNA-binding GntR family transcriptional regulator